MSDEISAAAALSGQDLARELDELFRLRASVDGRIVTRLGEAARQETFRADGATSVETWAVERFGISAAAARIYAHVGEKAWSLPQLVGSLCAGEMSFDKVRAVADVATPETDSFLCAQAREHSVRELADIARTTAARPRPDHQRRSLRFNDTFRTMTVQMPPESYAETRSCLETRARQVPSEGETPWDERLFDAFSALVRSSVAGAGTASPYLVVVHIPLEALVGDEADTDLAGELERDGLIDSETVRRIACDATVAVAVDDDVGHTMYEGRARRTPTDAQRREVMRRDRCCRFPGCRAVTFTNVHHIVPWRANGSTDLDNLALLCMHHHHLVHSKGWAMSGDANQELSIVGPSGREMASRPSPRWTRASAGARS
jgi:Domain of unknown function (DUF222)/HNH endonuclease